MARPFRFSAPDPGDDLVLRGRVQEVLAGRFERRVTCLVAGAGFGKTTALVQAFEENRLRPLGSDLWLACSSEDADPWSFARGLAVTGGCDDVESPDEVVGRLGERIGASSPDAVCLVLDDVQFLVGTPALALLDRLIGELPSNAHVVLCGRRLPEVTLTRLELIGEAAVIGEELLAFDDTEAA
ncbi:MAG: transcriptional regulator, partial [Actinomycetota bacterium]